MKDKVARAVIKSEAERSDNARRYIQKKLDALVKYLGVEFYDNSDEPRLICRAKKKKAKA